MPQDSFMFYVASAHSPGIYFVPHAARHLHCFQCNEHLELCLQSEMSLPEAVLPCSVPHA